jgi:hypothetical protein
VSESRGKNKGRESALDIKRCLNTGRRMVRTNNLSHEEGEEEEEEEEEEREEEEESARVEVAMKLGPKPWRHGESEETTRQTPAHGHHETRERFFSYNLGFEYRPKLVEIKLQTTT